MKYCVFPGNLLPYSHKIWREINLAVGVETAKLKSANISFLATDDDVMNVVALLVSSGTPITQAVHALARCQFHLL